MPSVRDGPYRFVASMLAFAGARVENRRKIVGKDKESVLFLAGSFSENLHFLKSPDQ